MPDLATRRHRTGRCSKVLQDAGPPAVYRWTTRISHTGTCHRRPDTSLTRASERDLVDRFRSLLQESVRLRLMADVPLGMFLSGGIDSSAIAALMTRELDRPIETFSVAFDESAFSELTHSRQAAQAIGANPHEIVVSDSDFFGALPSGVARRRADRPRVDVPLHFVSPWRVTCQGRADGRRLSTSCSPATADTRVPCSTEGGKHLRTHVPAAVRRPLPSSVVPRLPGRAGSTRCVRSWPCHQCRRDVLENFAGMRRRSPRELLDSSILRVIRTGRRPPTSPPARKAAASCRACCTRTSRLSGQAADETAR